MRETGKERERGVAWVARITSIDGIDRTDSLLVGMHI
jgi:hypothetical protein